MSEDMFQFGEGLDSKRALTRQDIEHYVRRAQGERSSAGAWGFRNNPIQMKKKNAKKWIAFIEDDDGNPSKHDIYIVKQRGRSVHVRNVPLSASYNYPLH